MITDEFEHHGEGLGSALSRGQARNENSVKCNCAHLAISVGG